MDEARQITYPPHRLRELRLAKGLTQEQLGAQVGRSATEINRFERGERDLYLRDLRALAAALNTDVGGLLNPADNQSRINLGKLEALGLVVDDPVRAKAMLMEMLATLP